MGQIMLNGNAYAGGMGSGCGCFIDTNNVIVPSTSSSPISYTATQDCAVVISAEMSGGSYIHVYIDNTLVCSYVSDEDATFCQTFFVRRGQNIGTRQFVSVTYIISYTVYGVIQGLDSTAQDRYSTEERAVGIWIDGSTIYEKTIILQSGVNLTRGSWTSVSAVSLSGNEDTFISTKALLPSHKAWMTFAGKNSGGTFQIFSETAFTIQGVIIQYTKAST